MKPVSKILTPGKQVLIANLATAGLGFITFFMLVRSLDLEVFGEWVLYITSFNLAEMVRTGLARQAMVHYLVASKSVGNSHYIKSGAFYLSLITGAVAGLVLLVIYLLFFRGDQTGIAMFFGYYPIVAFFTLIPSFDSWVSQSNGKMLRMSAMTFIPAFLLSIVGVASFFINISLTQLIIAHAVIRVLLSAIAFFTNSAVRLSIIKPAFNEVRLLWKYGKFSIATLLGTNLLKSADNFLIGYFLGPAAVAIYNVPLKLLEIAEIPARSVGQIMFPRLSKLFSNGNLKEMSSQLVNRSIKMSMVYLPFTVIAFFAAEWVVVLIGGSDVADGAIVLQIFLLYVLVLPIDRLIGVSIDSTGAPKYNSLKVWAMVILNVVGDIIALYVFDSMALVALVTVINALAGVLLGFMLFRRKVGPQNISFKLKFKSKPNVA
ncbi:MAG: oligosaccharide flippase family protein [Bacteroidia bacterium]